MTKFKVNETVIITEFINDDRNKYARVAGVYEDYDPPRYWVANLNMPYYGSISTILEEEDLEKA